MMAGGWIGVPAMLLAGIGIPLMALLNGAFGSRFGPPSAAVLTFGLAFICSAAFAMVQGGQPVRAMAAAPWYMLLPGMIVAFYMLSITHFGPIIGLGTAVVLVVLGQVVCAVVVDHLGLMGLPQVRVTGARMLGVVLIVTGVALARG